MNEQGGEVGGGSLLDRVMRDGLFAVVGQLLLGVSWRTSAAGYGAAMLTMWPELEAAFDGDPSTHVVWSRFIMAALLAVMGRTARDRAVSSEDERGARAGSVAPGLTGTRVGYGSAPVEREPRPTPAPPPKVYSGSSRNPNQPDGPPPDMRQS